MMPLMEGDFYGDAEGEIPLDMPKALGGSVRIYCFVDADHAGDKLTRRSHTGIIIKINNAVILAFPRDRQQWRLLPLDLS
jgi:hypothetical protein